MRRAYQLDADSGSLNGRRSLWLCQHTVPLLVVRGLGRTWVEVVGWDIRTWLATTGDRCAGPTETKLPRTVLSSSGAGLTSWRTEGKARLSWDIPFFRGGQRPRHEGEGIRSIAIDWQAWPHSHRIDSDIVRTHYRTEHGVPTPFHCKESAHLNTPPDSA